MIASKVAFEINIVALRFSRKSPVIGSGSLLLVIRTFARIIKHLLDAAVELTLKHTHSINRVFCHKSGKVRVFLPQVIDGNIKTLLLLSKHRFDLFSELSLAHVLCDSLFESLFLNVSFADHLVLGSTSRINLLHAIIVLCLVECFFAHKINLYVLVNCLLKLDQISKNLAPKILLFMGFWGFGVSPLIFCP